uniref:Uncharacterized protein n=1 Tax=Arundo donax TaxID=35708 RepID=A0A0A8YIW5_ARUDO
MSETPCSVE